MLGAGTTTATAPVTSEYAVLRAWAVRAATRAAPGSMPNVAQAATDAAS